MEKFMKETENVDLRSVTLRKGKLYDTENLLHILGSKGGKSCAGCPTPSDKPKMSVLPKRRKTQEKIEDIPPKKGKPNKTAKKTAPRLQYAKIHTISTVKWHTCQEIVYLKKRKAIRIHYCKSHKAKLLRIDIRNDSEVCKNNQPSVKVKEEVAVIDLTDQNDWCFMLLRFGKQHSLKNMSFEIAEEIPPIQYCKATASKIASELAVVTVPDVRDDNSVPVLDLTQLDEERAPPVAFSEKECANAILPIIYRFHEVFHNEEQSEKSKSVGYHLVQTLSGMFVKNINMPRFLEIVVSKLAEKFRLMLNATTVAYYLKTMFDANRQSCSNRLTQFLLKELDSYYAPIKSDSVIFADALAVVELEAEVFTQDQLQQLADQIRQYHELIDGRTVTIDIDEEYSDDYVFSWEDQEEEKVDIK